MPLLWMEILNSWIFMSKYTEEELKDIALSLIKAESEKDPRYLDFVMICSARARVSPMYVEEQIANYADH